MPSVLLVAPDGDLRSSIQFALYAEGYLVESAASVDGSALPGIRFDCTILDHEAAEQGGHSVISFCARFDPVILLANETPHPLSPYAARTMLKPLLGAALSEAISEAIATRGPPKYTP